MITPYTVIRVTEVQARNGDRATTTKPAWEVSVWRGEKALSPMPFPQAYDSFTPGPTFEKAKALAWAREVAYIVDASSIQLFKMQNGVAVFQEDLESE